ncbi:MAG: hypothetical protein WD988_00410 [Candidatus Curtissbacteria bacterium]
MVFVILGIVILFVSFAIALVSLIRDQSSLEEVFVEKREEPVERRVGEAAPPVRAQPPISGKVDMAREEQFPWEVHAEESRNIQNLSSVDSKPQTNAYVAPKEALVSGDLAGGISGQSGQSISGEISLAALRQGAE